MEHGHAQLKHWQERRDFNGREAARYLEIDHTYYSNLVTGKRLPGRDNAIKIERMTGIPVEAWSPTPDGKHETVGAGNGRKRK